MTSVLDYKNEYYKAQKSELKQLFAAEKANPGTVLERVNCPACDNSAYSLKYKKNKFSIVQCRACSFVYTNPRVAEDVYCNGLTQSRSSELWALHQETESVQAFNKGQYEFFFNKGIDKNKGNRYLDIGASTGVCLDLARENGFRTFAMEWSQTARAILEAKCHTIISSLERGLEAPFDWISFYEVLEHQHDPKQFLRRIKRVLSPEGIVSLSVPNIDSLACLLMGSAANSIDGLQHLNYFSKSSLVNMFSETGFTLEYFDTAIPATDQIEKFLTEQGNDISPSVLKWIDRDLCSRSNEFGLGYRLRAIFKNSND